MRTGALGAWDFGSGGETRFNLDGSVGWRFPEPTNELGGNTSWSLSLLRFREVSGETKTGFGGWLPFVTGDFLSEGMVSQPGTIWPSDPGEYAPEATLGSGVSGLGVDVYTRPLRLGARILGEGEKRLAEVAVG